MKSPSLQEIISLIGESAAADLVSQIGGVTYYFPEDGALSRHVTISPVAWSAMCQHFCGWVYVPKGFVDKLAARDLEIRAKRAAGAHIIDLAIEYQLTDRRIRSICGGVMKARPSQRGKDALGFQQVDWTEPQQSEVFQLSQSASGL